MGWNEGYTVMERAVVSAYDAGGLTRDRLKAMLEPYVGTDIDHGGCRDLRTKDGKSADEVILSLLAPERYERLTRLKALLDRAGIDCDSIRGGGEVVRGSAKVYQLYGGARAIRDRRRHCGFRVEPTKEWKFGGRLLEDYEECFIFALTGVTGWC